MAQTQTTLKASIRRSPTTFLKPSLLIVALFDVILAHRHIVLMALYTKLHVGHMYE